MRGNEDFSGKQDLNIFTLSKKLQKSSKQGSKPRKKMQKTERRCITGKKTGLPQVYGTGGPQDDCSGTSLESNQSRRGQGRAGWGDKDRGTPGEL